MGHHYIYFLACSTIQRSQALHIAVLTICGQSVARVAISRARTGVVLSTEVKMEGLLYLSIRGFPKFYIVRKRNEIRRGTAGVPEVLTRLEPVPSQVVELMP